MTSHPQLFNKHEKWVVVLLPLILTAVIVLVVHLLLDWQTDPHFKGMRAIRCRSRRTSVMKPDDASGSKYKTLYCPYCKRSQFEAKLVPGPMLPACEECVELVHLLASGKYRPAPRKHQGALGRLIERYKKFRKRD